MSWTNPPDAVTQMRTMLLACSSVTGAGFTSPSIHYPAVALETTNATAADALPAIAISEDQHTRTRYAEGARGLPGGTISVSLYMATDAGTLEALARAIADELELLGMSTGLPIRSAEAELCSDPSEPEVAAGETQTQAAHRKITIVVQYGLQV